MTHVTLTEMCCSNIMLMLKCSLSINVPRLHYIQSTSHTALWAKFAIMFLSTKKFFNESLPDFFLSATGIFHHLSVTL